MQKKRKTQQQRREEAQTAVLQSALKLFAEHGYHYANLEDIAQNSQLTTRPIYHYFGNKQGLFAAVVEQLERELTQAIEAAFNTNNPLINAWHAFIAICQRKDFRQIVLVDAPNILGRARWAESEVVKLAEAGLQLYLPDNPTKALLISRMLLVALAEAALLIAESENTDDFIDAANDIVEKVLANFS